VGNDPLRASGQSFRGQRVFCSNRGRRGGCGRTFSLVLADVLPRHTLTASLVWRWLVEVLAGLSLKAAAEKLRLPFALETVYRLRRGLRRKLDGLRTRLAGRCGPPTVAHADPLCQTLNPSPNGFSPEPVSPGGVSTPFSESVFGLTHVAAADFSRITAVGFSPERVPCGRQHNNPLPVRARLLVASPA
jgi:hypothetical protein